MCIVIGTCYGPVSAEFAEFRDWQEPFLSLRCRLTLSLPHSSSQHLQTWVSLLSKQGTAKRRQRKTGGERWREAVEKGRVKNVGVGDEAAKKRG